MKDQRFQFIKKKHSKGGIEALVLGTVSFGLLLAAIIVSWVKAGQAGILVGGLGITGALLSIFGFAVGMKSFHEKETSSFFSVTGSMVCGILFVIWLTMFVSGIRW